MSRIAKINAETIASKAIEDGQKERREANIKRWHDASHKAYKALLPKTTLEWLAAAPEGWLETRKEFEVRGSNGYTLTLKFPEPIAIKEEWRWNTKLILKDDKLTAEVYACMDEAQKLKEDASKTYRPLVASILAAGTWKKLELAWPEGLAYFASYLNAENKKAGTALTVEFSSVNKALGLPKSDAPARKPKPRKAA